MTDPIPRLEGKTFILPVRVYYEDTDAGGVVYYANYLKYAERARTEMLRHLGIENSVLQARHGLAFVVRHISVDYMRPARLDDRLEVSLILTKVGGATLAGRQVIRLSGADGGEDLVRMNIKLGCMKLDAGGEGGGAGRLPDDIRATLRAFEMHADGEDG